MQTAQNGRPTTRNFHGQKKQLLNQQAGKAPPAWKQQQQQRGVKARLNSKILLSELPMDVTPDEVVTLFDKTVGPVKEDATFIIHNNKGGSRGMAIVTFQREGDAYAARAKYNGKLIDGRKPIKIEIIKDEDAPTQAPTGAAHAAPQQPQSLLQRLGGIAPTNGKAPTLPPIQAKRQAQAVAKIAQAAPAALQPRTHVAGSRKLRQKKGAKRVKKGPMTVAQLDAEMEAYKAKSEDTTMG
ncbi:hypothetical protein BDW22DRAFT_1352844 [Trametopsis cervina]|nr:hypothetical protein BDW22DRAFT_1352844 [Trametopsis cervina]